MSGTSAVLAGVRVLDSSRMLPGAVLARSLLALGAEVIKLEDPRGGDPLRAMPPRRGDVGVGFSLFYAGARSVTARLGTEEGNAAVRALLQRTDVWIESFRPGTLAGWGLDPAAQRQLHPRLVTVSLPSFATADADRDAVAHDLNALARTGLLARTGAVDVPKVQLADVTCGLLAGQAVLAALLQRGRTDCGMHVEQPLCSGALPLLAWPWADAAACGRIGATDSLIGGAVPAYAIYRAGDGERLAVGCLEPKFWAGLCTLLELPDAIPDGLRTDARGEAARALVSERFASAPASVWVQRAHAAGLPVDRIVDVPELAAAQGDAAPTRWLGSLFEHVPMRDGSVLAVPSRLLPSFEQPPRGPAPALGEHSRAELAACGLSDAAIDACLPASAQSR
ncbi:MAG: CoA transferase [Nannocystaceae bacterium]|nr:CoA transferase [Nannocystaceae bacterium]